MNDEGETKMEHNTQFSDYKFSLRCQKRLKKICNDLDLEGNKKITTPRHLERFFKSNGLEPIGWEFDEEEYGDVNENGNRVVNEED